MGKQQLRGRSTSVHRRAIDYALAYGPMLLGTRINRVSVPVAAGENEFGEQGFRELFEAEAIDVAQPDASRTGGIPEYIKIAGLARKDGARIATHTWSDAVGVLASALRCLGAGD